ncbi:inc metabolism membrane protein [Didymosphaeria variabile]|uniref:Inc metabolism membrane protein n=1 Tax=Didymosphaeria variabile TaxID=1932322 RepID=A0A9W8X975_9PLEO|nr:inc metabolism membrane protein [Didymosphaeria variabile]KAJ4344663.1 inc metabolism membrane protein [Didymosphaeria variabile]
MPRAASRNRGGTSTAVAMAAEGDAAPVLRANRAYGTFDAGELQPPPRPSRRPSSSFLIHGGTPCVDSDNFHALLGGFLAELNCRLDRIDSYGQLKLDTGVEYAYSTLLAVRESCSKISDGAIEVGRRQAAVFVETLEGRYQHALESKETLAEKVVAGILLIEDWVTDLEGRAYSFRDAGIDTVNQELGWARGIVDAGLHKAHRARQSIELKIDYAVDRALARAKEHGLIRYEDLPEPWQANEHILTGYRFYDGHWACIRSICGIHNESTNIWTHLVGFMVMLGLAFIFYPQHINFHASTTTDIVIAAIFFFAACKCLLCSCIMHTMNGISHQTLLERYACIDYTGISLLVGASIMTFEYTAFYCEPRSRWAYMTLTALLSLGGVYLPWNPTFNRNDLAWLRVSFYVLLALTSLLPFFQLISLHGFEYTASFYMPAVPSMLIYFFGAIIYAARVPERWLPGRFDYLGASHNIWHVAVLCGIVAHYFAMQEMFSQAHYRSQAQCPGLPDFS